MRALNSPSRDTARSLRRWPYWDGDVSRMYDMYHRHRRLNDDVVMSLDADSILQSSATDTNATSDFDRAAQCASTEDALRTLGMLAMPSEFRQSRLERQREAAKRKESVARVSSGPQTSSAVVDIDPFAEYLQHDRGFAPARVSSKQPAGASSRPPSVRTAKPARRPTGGSYTNARKQGASTSVSRLARGFHRPRPTTTTLCRRAGAETSTLVSGARRAESLHLAERIERRRASRLSRKSAQPEVGITRTTFALTSSVGHN